MRTQGFGALALQPVGPSGQLGKEQTLPDAEDLFSRYGVRLGQSDSAPHARTCSVGAELLEYVQEQDGGTTETVSEAPGAYGGCGGSHAAGAAPYETASTLAPWTSPEVGVAERHAVGPSHSSLPPNLRPVILVRTDNTATVAYINRQGGLRTGTQLAAGPSQVCISPSEPSGTDTVQDQGGRGADPAHGAILAHPDLVPRAHAPRDSPSLADSSEEGSTD